jgi:copper(I)-binding protein
VNRALRAATAGVLLLSPLALAACSAGQVTQTATQERDKNGAMAQVGDLTLRGGELESPRAGAYERGDDAELRLAIVNSGEDTDTLVAVDGEGFAAAEIEGPSGTASGVGSGTSRASSDEIEVPSDSTVFVDGDDYAVTLTDLDQALFTGQVIELTLTFQNAGEVTLPVTVANPEDAEERGEAFDFHHEEGTEEGAEGAQREGGE